MTARQQQLAVQLPSAPSAPSIWQARRDYQRAERLARSLELSEPRASYFDPCSGRAAQFRRNVVYPLVALAIVALLTPGAIIPFPWTQGLSILIACPCPFLLLYAIIPLVRELLTCTLFHCEQAHLYANGFVYIDPRGRACAARWEQCTELCRGGHQGDRPNGRVCWDMLRLNVWNLREQRWVHYRIAPRLHESLEICAQIERGYCDYWLPRRREQLAAGEVLDFDALLLQREWLGKTHPGRRRFSAVSYRPPTTQAHGAPETPGMARGIVVQADEQTRIEWLWHADIKSVRIDERYILIRTIEPVRRDKHGQADRFWFQLDTLGLKEAAILKELLRTGEYRFAVNE